MKDVRIFIIMLLCLVLTGCSSMSDEEEAVERVKVGDHVPAFTVSMTDGSSQWTFNSKPRGGGCQHCKVLEGEQPDHPLLCPKGP